MTYEEMAHALLDCLPALRSHNSVQLLSNVTAGEFAALVYLVKEHNGATAGELTSAIHVGSSRTTAILQSMERKGLLQREEDPDDGRRVLAYLTDKGFALEEKERNKALSQLRELLEFLGQEDAETLTRILCKVLDFKKKEED